MFEVSLVASITEVPSLFIGTQNDAIKTKGYESYRMIQMDHMILASYKDVPRSLSLSKNLFISSFFLVYLIRCRTSKNGYVTGENIANIKWESRMQFLGESRYDWKKLTQKRFTLPSFLKIVMKTCTRFIWLHRCW